MFKTRFSFTFFCLFWLFLVNFKAYGQFKENDLFQSWVITEISHKDRSELPDDNILKYTFIKYTFTRPATFYQSESYSSLGRKMDFEVKGNNLTIKSAEGFVVNTLRILKVSENELIVVQPGVYGLDDPHALVLQFSREQYVQNSTPLSENDFFKDLKGDTIYRQSPKVYAPYKGGDFGDEVKVGDENFMTGKSGHLIASFIIDKNGKADSLKILKGISPAYDKLFIKEFARLKKKWLPALLNGTPVNVEMRCEKRYFDGKTMIPAMMHTMRANGLFKEKDYAGALEEYNLALKLQPEDTESLYYRSICYKSLGNIEKACQDWKQIVASGKTISKILLEKYCK